MNVIGLDLALTTTGWATADGHGLIETGSLRGPERLDHILQCIAGMLSEDDDFDAAGVGTTDVRVVVEGPSFGSRGNSLVEIGKLHGLVEHMLWSTGVPYVVGASPKRKTPTWGVPPGTLKKYATGSGNCSKTEMVVAARERLGYDVLDDNVADAIFLREIGLELCGQPAVKMPKRQREALKRLEWSGDD